jgi:hypothetical protein
MTASRATSQTTGGRRRRMRFMAPTVGLPGTEGNRGC